MDKLRLIFSRKHHVGSMLVRLGTWSQWGHCGIVTDYWNEARVIEATAMYGVIERPLHEFLEETSEYAFKEVEVPNAEAGIEWARSQLGKSYDWTGVIGMPFHREWGHDDKWFCSEFCETAIYKAGRKRFSSHMNRATPQHVWMVA